MKKQVFSVLVMLCSAQYLFGQGPNIEKESWSDKPKISVLDSKYSKESAVIIYDGKRVDYIDGAKDDVEEYYTIHKIIHINDDRGIEDFNKIYLGINENSDIVDIKARTLLPGGKIIELDKNNIKDIKQDDGNIYKIFAMEGLEKGCEVEYFYTYKKPTAFFGREVQQSIFPVLESKFEIIGPKRLRFEVKPYNFTQAASDTVINEKRITKMDQSAIVGVQEEKYATYEANLKRIEFKLSYNAASAKGERLFTWDDLAKRVASVYTDFTDNDKKDVAAIITENGWAKLRDERAKIIAVENYVKKGFAYNEELTSDDGNTLENVLKNKVSGTIGALRLYSAIFANLGVKYQYVLSGNRTNFMIDRAFENWNNCENPLLYFPAEDKFLAPSRPDYRYPWIFPSWGGTNGLFCKNDAAGNVSNATAEIKTIPLEDYTKSFENIESKLEFNKGLDSLTIDCRQLYAGYASINYRDAFNFSNEEQKRNIIKELAKSYSGSDNIISSEVLNQEFEKESENAPLILHTKTKSGELIEMAGNKLLLKIGMAIGPQVEMYQEKARQEPVDMDFAHVEERRLNVVIPPGYKITNPEDLKINETHTENGNLTMGFVSDYQVKGNILTVHIMEQYRSTVYPLNQFDQFRKIINASSDFNKVVLVLEKK